MHNVEFSRTSKEVWSHLKKYLLQMHRTQVSLKQQVFSLKMTEGVSEANHVNHLKSLMSQPAGIGVKLNQEDAIAIFLKSMLACYDNVLFTVAKLPHQKLEFYITALLEEKKMMTSTQNV
jgi:hypothetical protein